MKDDDNFTKAECFFIGLSLFVSFIFFISWLPERGSNIPLFHGAYLMTPWCVATFFIFVGRLLRMGMD